MEAYVNHAFNTSVESVFQEFKRGFFLVCDQDLVRLFRPEELQGVLVGQDVYDWEKFKQVQSAKQKQAVVSQLQQNTCVLYMCLTLLTHLQKNNFHCLQNTVYELEHVRHSTIKMFWEVFDELTEEQRKDFLRKYLPNFLSFSLLKSSL